MWAIPHVSQSHEFLYGSHLNVQVKTWQFWLRNHVAQLALCPIFHLFHFSKKYRSYYHVCSILVHSIVITWSCGMWMWSLLKIVCIWNCNKISWIVYSYLFIYCSHENIVYGFYLGPLFYGSEFCCLSSWCFSCNVIRLSRSYKVYGVGVSYYLKCQYWVDKSEEDKYHNSLSDIFVPTMFSWN
jgi:hypothetical protein